MWIIIAIIIIGGIILFIRDEQKKKERQQKMEVEISSMTTFTPSQKIVGVDNHYTFMVDYTRKQICYLDPKQKRIIPYDNILKVELIENGNTVSSKSTVRTIGGALVGGVLAGGAGAVVGGLSGRNKSENEISSIKVKITIRDIDNPSLTIDAFNASTMMADGKPIKPNGIQSYLYEKATSDANKIHDIIQVIIEEVDREAKKQETPVQSVTSIAGELKKLADLKDEGILTQEEFESQKAKLLNL
jgi:hypothetical protein